jgi:hypothetical protein
MIRVLFLESSRSFKLLEKIINKDSDIDNLKLQYPEFHLMKLEVTHD